MFLPLTFLSFFFFLSFVNIFEMSAVDLSLPVEFRVHEQQITDPRQCGIKLTCMFLWPPSHIGQAHIVHISCNSLYVWAVEAEGTVYQRIGARPPSENSLSPAWLAIDSFDTIVFTRIYVGQLDWLVCTCCCSTWLLPSMFLVECIAFTFVV